MAYSEALAGRVREALKGRRGVREIRMMGGLCFTLGGRMCCGVLKRNLVVRVAPGDYDRAVSEPHARPMDFTGKPLRGFLYVGPAGTRTAAGLRKWVGRGVDLATSPLPKRQR